MIYYVSEIYDMMAKAKNEEERTKVLLNNRNNQVFVTLLQNLCDPKVRFHFDVIPSYRPLVGPRGAEGYISFAEALDRLYIFAVGDSRANPNITQKQREKILFQTLESLSAEEAVIYANLILKKTGIEGFDAELVKKTFPYLVEYA